MARKSPWDISMAHRHCKACSGSSVASSEEQNVCPCNETGELRSWGISIVLTRLQSMDDTSGGSKNADVYDTGRIFIVFCQLLKRILEPLFYIIWGFFVCTGICSFPCECNSWNHRVWSIRSPLSCR